MPVHYAPRTPAFRVQSLAELEGRFHRDRIAVVSFREASGPAAAAEHQFTLETPEKAARLLYDVLHQCDSLGLGAIVVIMPPEGPEWHPLRDRLLRATRPLP
jgi:hypothetical protein